MINEVLSKNGTPIRLTDERWTHITEEHCELAGLRTDVLETVFQPERILAGGEGELIAVREIEQGKRLVVVYREHKDDGFVITAFITSKARLLAKRRQYGHSRYSRVLEAHSGSKSGASACGVDYLRC